MGRSGRSRLRSEVLSAVVEVRRANEARSKRVALGPDDDEPAVAERGGGRRSVADRDLKLLARGRAVAVESPPQNGSFVELARQREGGEHGSGWIHGQRRRVGLRPGVER